MKKIALVTWSIIEYPQNSGVFELQGGYEPYGDAFLVKIIPYDFHSFDPESKIGKSDPDGLQLRDRATPLESTEYQLVQFIPNDKVTNEKLALEIIKEWSERPNYQCLFQRSSVLNP